MRHYHNTMMEDLLALGYVETDQPDPIRPLPRAEWPVFITTLATYLKGDDKGVGDSVRRAADALGHKVVVAGLRACGIKCSCDERLDSVVAYLNSRFPYENAG